jgi:hypothetical protein
VGYLDEALPPGPDWIGRELADLRRQIRELAAARTIEATLGGTPADIGDLTDAVGTLPAPGQVARRDEANSYAATQRFEVAIALGPTGSVLVAFGTGTPEGVVTADVGSTFHRTDGGAGTSLYIKQSGTGNTGWVAVVP